MQLSGKTLKTPNIEAQIEYQTDTIGKYRIDFNGVNCLLTTKQTSLLS
nr:hypothetical protein [Tenacibaculum maritimum]